MNRGLEVTIAVVGDAMGLGRVENGLRCRTAPSFPRQGDPSRQGLSRGARAQRAAGYLAPGARHAERQLLQ